jgi:hypothetical protein
MKINDSKGSAFKAVSPTTTLETTQDGGIVMQGVPDRRKRRTERVTPKPGRPRGVAYEHLLGIMSDTEIARQYGITASTVAHTRKRRGIPAWRNKP